MSTEIPLWRQETPETCALACLRMVLAAFGKQVAEGELRVDADLTAGGIAIEDLERLARGHGLRASIQPATAEELRALLDAGLLSIAYLNRAAFVPRSLRAARKTVRAPVVHAVVPVRITMSYVTFNDPLIPAVVRKSIARFSCAQQHVGSTCLVCGLPESEQ